MKDTGGILDDSIAASQRVPATTALAASFIAPVASAEVINWPGAGISRGMTQVAEYKEGVEKRWNTKNLPGRIAVDALSGACAAALVAPLIATIDRGIMENASGKATLKDSLIKSLKTMILRPHKFIFCKPMALIFTVYGSTYLVANSVDTAASTVKSKPASYVTHGTAKFAGTSITNLSVGIWKDSQFTKLFSTAAPRPLPKPTYLLFALRDSLTIFASFNVPPLLAPHIPRELLPEFMKGVKSQSIAQFMAPAAVQILSTPIHLLGLDLYNRQNLNLAQRWELVRGAWIPSFVARVCRIVPAFGVGGVVNTSVRDKLMRKLE